MNCERLPRIKVIDAEVEPLESTENRRSSESSNEQVWDEQAQSRMDDEGCPDYRQKRDPREVGIGMVKGS